MLLTAPNTETKLQDKSDNTSLMPVDNIFIKLYFYNLCMRAVEQKESESEMSSTKVDRKNCASEGG